MVNVMTSEARNVLYNAMPHLPRTGDAYTDTAILVSEIKDPGRSGGPYDRMYGNSGLPLGPSYRAELAEMRVATRMREEALAREMDEKYFAPVRRFGQRIIATVDPVYARLRHYSRNVMEPPPKPFEISAKPVLRAMKRIIATINRRLDQFDDFVDHAYMELTNPAYREMNSRMRTITNPPNVSGAQHKLRPVIA